MNVLLRFLSDLTILQFLQAVLFLVGFGIIPMMAYSRLRLPIISRGVAWLTWTLPAVAVGTPAINQREDGSYEVRKAKSSWGPADYWSRLGLTAFAVTFDATRDAFSGAVYEREEVEAVPDINEGESEKTKQTVPIERGGVSTYFEPKFTDGDWFVNAAEWLGTLKDVASAGMMIRVREEAFNEYGGDSSGMSMPWMIAGTFLFLLTGAAMGYVIFF